MGGHPMAERHPTKDMERFQKKCVYGTLLEIKRTWQTNRPPRLSSAAAAEQKNPEGKLLWWLAEKKHPVPPEKWMPDRKANPRIKESPKADNSHPIIPALSVIPTYRRLRLVKKPCPEKKPETEIVRPHPDKPRHLR